MSESPYSALERLRNYRTRYEIAATHPDGRRVLVRYTSRRSRYGLLSAMRQGPSLITAFGLTADSMLTWGKRAADGCTLGDWRIAFTGRTQRECIIEGELPFYADGGQTNPSSG